MSRHQLVPKNKNHEVVVGWDHPLLTYFVIVKDKTAKGDDQVICWVGTQPRQLYEVEDVLHYAKLYADIPPNLGVKLYGDKDNGR